jgi:hypothetical protein
MVNDLLIKLEEEKDNWIYEAIDHFNEGFLRFDGQKYEKDQVLIGVYGPTQVGKTTLILTMLGIGDDQIGPLSQALRGKRQKGNSSTITSFIYKRSDNENFYLVFPDKTKICCRNLEELETKLHFIRQQIEGGKVSYDKPIILDIAQQYFTNKRFADKSKHISIIDLPGDDTKEIREKEYVDHILTKYMPLCSVCLVMEISSKVVRLFQLDSPLVKDWMFYPQNFRLVLTRCLQSTSVKNVIENGEIASLEDFRKYYKDHLNRNDVEIPNQIYPLEFGDTWLELKERNSTVYEKSKNWIDRLFLELLTDLTAVKTPENQILQIKNIEYSIRKQKDTDLERMEKEIKLIRESIEEVQESSEHLASIGEYLQEELEFYVKDIKELEKIQLEKFNCLLYGKFSYDKKDQVVLKERKISKLNESFKQVELEMLDFYQKQITKSSLLLQQILRNVSPSERFDFKTNPPTVGLTLKHGKGLDQYLSLRNFEEDYGIVLEALRRNNDIVYDYYFNQINHFKRDGKKVLMRLWKERFQDLRRQDEQVKEKQELKRQREAWMEEIQEKLDRAKKEWEQDLERPDKLDEILKDEFLKAVSRWQDKLFSDQVTDVERWAYHHYSQIILNQAERILNNDYFQYDH